MFGMMCSQRAACGTFLKRDLHHVGDFNANASANAQYLKSMVDKDATSVEFLCVKNNFEIGQLHERHGRGCQKSTTCLEICGSVHDGVVGQMRECAIDCTLKK